MKIKFIAFFVCALLCAGSEAQVTYNGITLPPTIKSENTELMLNGGGIRKKLFFKLYTAGLYLSAKNNNAEDIVSADKPTAIRMTITSGVLNNNNMSEAIQEGFDKSLNGNTAPLQTKINSFIATFKAGKIAEGDVFELWYVPGVGVKSYKNGKFVSTVEGLDFKKALFGIWMGSNPVDADLKSGFLGNKP